MIVQPKLETKVTKKYIKHWVDDFDEILHYYKKDKPNVCAIDSETTGLHIIKDKPFMWVFGWLIPKRNRIKGIKGRVFAFEHSTEMLKKVIKLSKKMKFTFGHNVKYDLHMAINGGISEEEIYNLKNIVDTMAVARIIFESVSVRDGGDALGLKPISEKYIDPKAAEFETEVKKELRKINDQKRQVLKDLLKPIDGWGIGKIKEVYKVKKRGVLDIYTLEKKKRWIEIPKQVENIYKQWIEEYPSANYSEVDRNVMMEYVHSDGIYTLELAEKGFPKVRELKQLNTLKQECELQMILLKMERVGLKVDMDYLNRCDLALEQEIQKSYEELWGIVGQYFTVSQDQVILDYYENKLGYRPESSDKAFLKKQKDDRVAKLISRIRRLEKWQSTYISRIKEVSEYDGYFYTQFNQYGTVSGRLSSDAQQFPKERILTEEGEMYEKENGEGSAPVEMELFYPRRAFIVHGGKYNKIALFDLSQIELRVQANYTILLNKPDVNLCRAYMPFKCKHYKTGEEYSFETPEDRNRWNEKQPNGDSVWLLEDGTPWTPVDNHAETTHNTLVEMGYTCHEKYKKYTHPDMPTIDETAFKIWRSKGKIFNFMRNYGGGKGQAMKALDLDPSSADALVTGWSKTFPNVAYYQQQVSNQIKKHGYAINMVGRRYHLKNTDKAYRIGNYLVQGSCADELKKYMIKIDRFLTENNLKTKQLLNIHDELQLLVYDGEEWIFPKIKEIMENVEWMKVPVEVDLEITETNWAEAKERDVNEFI